MAAFVAFGTFAYLPSTFGWNRSSLHAWSVAGHNQHPAKFDAPEDHGFDEAEKQYDFELVAPALDVDMLDAATVAATRRTGAANADAGRRAIKLSVAFSKDDKALARTNTTRYNDAYCR